MRRTRGLLTCAALLAAAAFGWADPPEDGSWRGVPVSAERARWLDALDRYASADEQQRGFILEDLRYAGEEAQRGIASVIEEFGAALSTALEGAGAERVAAECRERLKFLRGDIREQLGRLKGSGPPDRTSKPSRYMAEDLAELDVLAENPLDWAIARARALAPRAAVLPAAARVLDALSGSSKAQERWSEVRKNLAARLPRALVLDHRECTRFAEENARVREANARLGADLPEDARAVVEATNAYREAMGLRALTIDSRLTTAARGHSEEMTRLNYFSHDSPTKGMRDVGERAEREGVKSVVVGENIARGDFSPAEIVLAWRDSPGHHRNLIHAGFRTIGVGRDGEYWTAVYAGEER